jgi:hypothetical protein
MAVSVAELDALSVVVGFGSSLFIKGRPRGRGSTPGSAHASMRANPRLRSLGF